MRRTFDAPRRPRRRPDALCGPRNRPGFRWCLRPFDHSFRQIRVRWRRAGLGPARIKVLPGTDHSWPSSDPAVGSSLATQLLGEGGRRRHASPQTTPQGDATDVNANVRPPRHVVRPSAAPPHRRRRLRPSPRPGRRLLILSTGAGCPVPVNGHRSSSTAHDIAVRYACKTEHDAVPAGKRPADRRTLTGRSHGAALARVRYLQTASVPHCHAPSRCRRVARSTVTVHPVTGRRHRRDRRLVGFTTRSSRDALSSRWPPER